MKIITKYDRFLESIKPSDMWDVIPESVKELHRLFKSKDKKLYLVGGSVRDFLTGDTPKDFDLATDATPDEVLSIIGKRWRTTSQGEAFLVVVVYTEDQPKGIEIATFRSDEYGDLLGKTRNPITKISTIEGDAARRDLTYNSLFYDLDQRKIVDLVGGIEDLKNGITRFVGDPDMRIKEDPLRILRLVRFSSRYQYKIDEVTSKSIVKNKEQLSIIVQNRIWDEFYKAYNQVKNFENYLELISRFGLWEYIFGDLKINDNIIHCNSIEVYLGNLFKYEKVLNFEDFKNKLIQKFLIPNEISRVVSFLVWFEDFTPDKIMEYYTKRNNYKISDDILNEWIRVAGLKNIEFEKFIGYKPSVSAEELMKQGFKGADLGRRIKELEIEKFKNLL